jgi:hypothetical protein
MKHASVSIIFPPVEFPEDEEEEDDDKDDTDDIDEEAKGAGWSARQLSSDTLTKLHCVSG